MSLQYTPGTIVWAKLVNKIWWPGEIVEKSQVLGSLYDYMMKRVKNCFAIVFFPSDKSYEFVQNPKKICLYSSDKKLSYVEYGYNLNKRQKNGGSTGVSFDMENFITDVITFEKKIKGDVCIFKPFEAKDVKDKEFKVSMKDTISKLFTPSRKKCIQSFINPEPLKTNTKNKKSATEKAKSHAICTKKSTNCEPKNKHISYNCILKDHYSCNFITNEYKVLEQHMATHTKAQENIKEISPNIKRSFQCCSTSLSLPAAKKFRNKEKVVDKESDEILNGDKEVNLDGSMASSPLIFNENNVTKTNLNSNSENKIKITNDYESNEVENKSIESVLRAEQMEIIESNVANTFNNILDGKEDNLEKGSETLIDINDIASNASEKEIENRSEVDVETISNNSLDLLIEEDTSPEKNDTRLIKELSMEKSSCSEIKLPEEIELCGKKDTSPEKNDTRLIKELSMEKSSCSEMKFPEEIELCGKKDTSSEMTDTGFVKELRSIEKSSCSEIKLPEKIEFCGKKDTSPEMTDTGFVKELRSIEKSSCSEIKLPEEIELCEKEVESNAERILKQLLEKNPEIENVSEESTLVPEHDEIDVNNSTVEIAENNLECIHYLNDVDMWLEKKSEVWKKFAYSRNEEVKKFATVLTNQCSLNELMGKTKDITLKTPVISGIDQPNKVDYKIQPRGPPAGYVRYKAWSPFPVNYITENHDKYHELKKELMNQMPWQHENLQFKLNCKLLHKINHN